MDTQINEMLKRWGAGDRKVESVVFSHLHKELRRLAGRETIDAVCFDLDRHVAQRLATCRQHPAGDRITAVYCYEDIARDTRMNPMKAPPFSFPAHLHEAINGSSIRFFDVVANSGWGDKPLESAKSQPL